VNVVLFGGGVTGSGVFWVVELKRDPHALFESEQWALNIQDNSETRHWMDQEQKKLICFKA
jgi:hypothetical protein